MKAIHELQRLNSPFPKPQGICADGATLWLSSRATRKVYALNKGSLQVMWETPTPDGLITWGLTKVGEELRAVIGGEGGTDDVRTIRRCLPGHGFDTGFRWSCPEESGSHLSHDGRNLILSQWYPRKLVYLGDEGQVEKVIQANHGICGQVFVDGSFYLVTTEKEDTNEYWLTRVDPHGTQPVCTDLALIPFQARGLAFDGVNFWTNHRDANQIVCFAKP